LGQGATARHYYQASYAIREGFDDPAGMALALNHLGDLALAESHYQEAHDLYRQSISLYQQLSDRGGLAHAFYEMGVACAQGGDRAEAQRHFEQALRTAAAIQAVPLTLSFLVGIGQFFLDGETYETGVAALALAATHPATEQPAREKAQQLLSQNGGVELPHHVLELDLLIPVLLADLTAVPPLDHLLTTPPAFSEPAPAYPLLDPLSQRELEVLQAIAAGLKNQEIADRLVVSLSTVKTHVNNIYSKLGVTNRVQAVERARTLNLLD
jgi:ATP/maltotriose-dependent transcriptional regulator MalT